MHWQHFDAFGRGCDRTEKQLTISHKRDDLTDDAGGTFSGSRLGTVCHKTYIYVQTRSN